MFGAGVMRFFTVNQMFKLVIGLSVFFCFFPSLNCEAQVSEFAINSDNDAYLFINQDQYYTNGISFNYRHLRNDRALKRNQVKQIWSLSLGHKLYNAYNGFSEVALMDRPFTAYLYLRGGQSRFYKNESVLNMAVETGLYGKGAFGEPLQKAFHNLFGFYHISGWDYQLNNNFVLDVKVNYHRLFWRNKKRTVDLQIGTKISAGLNQNYVGVGPIIRMGKINPLYRSAYHSSRLNAGAGKVEKERYFYYKPVLFYRVYDASIQGGMLLHDKGPMVFDIKPWMFSQQVGFTYAKNRITIDAHLQFNTKEVESDATAHQYGAITVGYML
ncbi:hypothetical protein SAMN05661044_01931 [Olivibacter domesticus]|uniref:Lipid A deacylase LpxR family protein n=2 Tax=Olivibacter domesticus TaxID=407022 RepID=A0A1H7MCL5_OLID1|nr:hypothetical protein SAMN05661044_01931 [Olivibacter domesticus]